MEWALHDVPLYREFAGLEGPMRRLPDESTILRFRHLLEHHEPGDAILGTVTAILQRHGLMLKTWTVVDATLVAAPSATKNRSGERDPEMLQTKKGNQSYFGMKAHVGSDAESGLVHTVVSPAANVDDVTRGHDPLHGEEPALFADAGYQGAMNRPDATGVMWHAAMRPGKRRALELQRRSQQLLNEAERLKASVRVKVERAFRVIELQFGFTKVRSRGEEHGATGDPLRAVEPVDGSKLTSGSDEMCPSVMDEIGAPRAEDGSSRPKTGRASTEFRRRKSSLVSGVDCPLLRHG